MLPADLKWNTWISYLELDSLMLSFKTWFLKTVFWKAYAYLFLQSFTIRVTEHFKLQDENSTFYENGWTKTHEI